MTQKSLFKGRMKKVTGSAAVVFLALGVLGSTQALAGIANTKHNLGSTGTGVNKTTGTGEICVFCHTPHGADTSASVPLWNRKMAAANTYTTYNSLGTSSLDGATAPVGSVSLACLSCHDGVTAMSTMINAPGSGGYNNTSGTALGGTWSGANQSGGTLNVTGQITNIGQDLRNDHPIGIQYAGGPKAATVPAAGSTYDNTLFNDADFKATASATINTQAVWWVETSGTGTGRQKADMQLYTRVSATANFGGTSGTAPSTVAQPYVECASCHDPHIDNGTTFLRVSNSGSAVCLACHTK